ncbi:MAG: peptidoglycan-binding protein LysM [Chitinophagales bacterium]|nr:peptidoglycan-binding protein LysM [Chitinophagales bacterium]
MGLFSFLKNAGAKLFNKTEETKPAKDESNNVQNDVLNQQKAVLLKGAVEGLGLAIDELDIQLDGDIVIVSGIVTSQEDREKVILALGNVEGVATVDDRIIVNEPEPKPEAQFYEVQRGDSLSKIAKSFYGNAMKYPVIFEANKPMLKDPNLIYPGQVLRIPAIED